MNGHGISKRTAWKKKYIDREMMETYLKLISSSINLLW